MAPTPTLTLNPPPTPAVGWLVLLVVLLVAPLACEPGMETPSGQAERSSVVLLLTADLHSRMLPEEQILGKLDAENGLGAAVETASVGGIARIASLVRRQRDEQEATFFLDAGDLVEGGVLYPRFGGEPELLAMNAAGVDARALGNHDGTLLDRAGRPPLEPPLLAANLTRRLGAGAAGSGTAEPLVVLRRGGVTIAVIGVGRLAEGRPDLPASAEAVLDAVASVRGEVDVIVLLSHLGSELDRALLERLSGIDVVLGGHSHDVLPPSTTALDCGPATVAELGCTPRSVPLVHVGAYGRLLGRVELLVSRAPEDVRAARVSGDFGASLQERPSAILEVGVQHLPIRGDVPEDEEVAAALDPYVRVLVQEGMFHPLATAPGRVARFGPGGGDSALGNFVAAAARAGAGADLAVVPASALRADIEPGRVTGETLHRALPFEDRRVALELTGAELAAAFRRFGEGTCERGATEVHLDGATARFACAGGVRARDPELRVGGAPVEPSALYRLITTTFLAERGRPFDLPGRLVGAPDGNERLRDGVARSLRSLPPCVPDATGTRLPCLDGRAGALTDGRIRLDGGLP